MRNCKVAMSSARSNVRAATKWTPHSLSDVKKYATKFCRNSRNVSLTRAGRASTFRAFQCDSLLARTGGTTFIRNEADVYGRPRSGWRRAVLNHHKRNGFHRLYANSPMPCGDSVFPYVHTCRQMISRIPTVLFQIEFHGNNCSCSDETGSRAPAYECLQYPARHSMFFPADVTLPIDHNVCSPGG